MWAFFNTRINFQYATGVINTTLIDDDSNGYVLLMFSLIFLSKSSLYLFSNLDTILSIFSWSQLKLKNSFSKICLTFIYEVIKKPAFSSFLLVFFKFLQNFPCKLEIPHVFPQISTYPHKKKKSRFFLRLGKFPHERQRCSKYLKN